MAVRGLPASPLSTRSECAMLLGVREAMLVTVREHRDNDVG